MTRREWISPRGYACLGDDPPPCRGLCSRVVKQNGSKREIGPEGCCDGKAIDDGETPVRHHVVDGAGPDRR